MGKISGLTISASDIDKHLWVAFCNYDYRLSNIYIFGSESDFFAISKSGYTVEVEIKISKSDFKNDFKKTTTSGGNKHEHLLSDKTYKPNQFYFAVPEGLIKSEDIAPQYGLIYCTKYGSRIVKRAKYLHKEKHLDNKVFLKRLLDKFYYRFLDLKRSHIANGWNEKNETKPKLF